ncbi:sensor histidine kinase [Desulfofustis glycolicus]|uniref:histidine kinase n=1 Tax=Desulfofustis glycolicus DSM 9705 TaxID=1121409 RepID=A0A1M5Y1R0_9BACT|nr:ATP-binding protein [Desulfofustis glycolicus]SHI05879.1 Histidine kinase-, DNA gyrase B-, and HSP90-like ATPase [Desulfofustis glycolicus DSM 9705]
MKRRRAEIDINDILADVVAVTEHTLSLSHIITKLACEPELPPIVGDPEKLRQVFVNLINNAHHAMQEHGGQLNLVSGFDRDRQMVTVTVRDTGHGIDEKNQARIFDPFFTTKPVGQGTGLGLSVSYGIIHEHGGTIEVESPVPGERQTEQPGTQFVIRLPVADQRHDDEPTQGSTAA